MPYTIIYYNIRISDYLRTFLLLVHCGGGGGGVSMERGFKNFHKTRSLGKRPGKICRDYQGD